MNYRHAFHAGNFADVLKHTVLVRVLLHLLGKDSAFRAIETHAGIGCYDLAGKEAARTGEWRNGIGKLWEHPLSGEAEKLIAPYLDLVRRDNPDGRLEHYPGSPAIIRALARPQDRMIFCELHDEDHSVLRHFVARDRRAKAIHIDGWTGLKAYLPPKERRGLVLLDPAFEEPDEFAKLANAMAEAHRRWATGMYLVWYPVKNEVEARAFERNVMRLNIPKLLRIEFAVDAPQEDGALHACGMMAVNPPWTLENELKILLPALAKRLGGKKGGYRLAWLAR